MPPRFPSNRALVIAATAAGAVATAATAYYLIKRHRQASQKTPSHPPPSNLSLCIYDGVASHHNQNHSPSYIPALCHLRTSYILHAPVAPSPQTCNWLQQPQHDVPASSARQFPWAVFWDLENVKIPSSVQPSAFIHALRIALRKTTPNQTPGQTFPILRFMAVTNTHATPLKVRTALQSNGVSLLHVDSQTRKDACDKALITELCLLPREHAPPMGVALLSNDVDFAYPLARLSALGYHTVVVTSRIEMISRTLATVPRTVLTFDNIIAHMPLSTPQQNSRRHPRSSPSSGKRVRQQHNEKRSPQNTKHTHKTSPKRSPASSNTASLITDRKAKQTHRDQPAAQQKVSDKVLSHATHSPAQSSDSPCNRAKASHQYVPTSDHHAVSTLHAQPPKHCAKSSASSQPTKGKTGNQTTLQKSTAKKQCAQPQKRCAKSSASSSPTNGKTGNQTASQKSTAKKQCVQPQKRCAKSSASSSPTKGKTGKQTPLQKSTAKKQCAQSQKRCATSSASSSPTKAETGEQTTLQRSTAKKQCAQSQKRCATSSASSSPTKAETGGETTFEKSIAKKQSAYSQTDAATSSAAQSSCTLNAGEVRCQNAPCSQQNVSNNIRQPCEQQADNVETSRMQSLLILRRTPAHMVMALLLCFLILFRASRDHMWAQRWLHRMCSSW